MQNKTSLLTGLLVLVLLCGCTASRTEKGAAVPEQPSLEKKIREADALLKQKRYQQAFVLYAEAQKETQDIRLFRELQLRIAGTQFEMGNYPAALGALAPMPELPATLNDCRKLVLAAKILQKMNAKGEYVESLLEVALDNSIEEPGVLLFKAFGYTELGRVYVAHQKTLRAVKCFDYAARLYKACGDEENARICKNIMEYLK